VHEPSIAIIVGDPEWPWTA